MKSASQEKMESKCSLNRSNNGAVIKPDGPISSGLIYQNQAQSGEEAAIETHTQWSVT